MPGESFLSSIAPLTHLMSPLVLASPLRRPPALRTPSYSKALLLCFQLTDRARSNLAWSPAGRTIFMDSV